MADMPQAAVDAATDEVTRWMLEWGWISGITDEQVRAVSRDAVTRALEVAAPALGEHAASKILAHMEAHVPPDATRAGICRRLFGIAARVAAGAFLTDDDVKRQAAEAVARGDFIACVIPEDPAAP